MGLEHVYTEDLVEIDRILCSPDVQQYREMTSVGSVVTPTYSLDCRVAAEAECWKDFFFFEHMPACRLFQASFTVKLKETLNASQKSESGCRIDTSPSLFSVKKKPHSDSPDDSLASLRPPAQWSRKRKKGTFNKKEGEKLRCPPQFDAIVCESKSVKKGRWLAR